MRSRAIDTHWLTETNFQPAAQFGGWQWRHLAAAAALLILLVTLGRGPLADLLATSRDLAAAREAQAGLAAEVAHLRTELAVERATRGEVEQQAAVLSAQVAELAQQVEFLTVRKAANARAK
jgi:hypothetical protein